MKRSLIVALALFAGACGNSSTSTTTEPTATTASTFSTLTFTSTVTGAPVAGARVVVAGTAYTTDADGAINLSAPAATGATMDVSAPGFLDRVTLVGFTGSLTLWEIPGGADVGFIRQLAYNRGGTPEVLWRPAATTIALVLVGDAAIDPEVRAAHVRAAAMATRMTGDKVTFAVADRASAGMSVTMQLSAAGTSAATTFLTQTGGTITGARVEYPDLAAARNPRVIAHELGHVLGFGHAPSGFMCPTACGVDDFGPTEQAVFFSMLLRSPGTAPPDNDRSLGARSAGATRVFSCDVK